MNSECLTHFGNWKASYVALVAMLLRRRKELRLSQEVLAKQLKVGRRTFQRWEDGRVEPPAKRLFQWAAALGVEIAPVVAQSGAAKKLTVETVSRVRQDILGLGRE